MIVEERNAIVRNLSHLIAILSIDKSRCQANDDEVNQAIQYLENEKRRLATLDEQIPPPCAYGAFRIISSLPRALSELLIDWKEIPGFRDKVLETSSLSNQYAEQYRKFP